VSEGATPTVFTPRQGGGAVELSSAGRPGELSGFLPLFAGGCAEWCLGVRWVF
jgi:hypothetical protein